MKWSKLKQVVESQFAESVRGRVHVHSTRYQCSCGRGWITLDGKEIADFSTRASGDRYRAIYHETTHTACARHPAVEDSERSPGRVVEVGEFSRFDLHEACWAYAHSSVAESLASANPLVQCLAVLDRRVGKQRLRRMLETRLHPLTEKLVRFRLREEASNGRKERVSDSRRQA